MGDLLAWHESGEKRYKEIYGIFEPDNAGKTIIVELKGYYAWTSTGRKLWRLPDGRLSKIKPDEYEPLDHFVSRIQAQYKTLNKLSQRRKRQRGSYHLSVDGSDFVIARNGLPWYRAPGGMTEGAIIMDFLKVHK